MSAAPPFPPNLATLIETYKKRYGEAWYPSIDTMLLLHVLGYRLPESEGQSSEAITSTETSECPARQSGSPEVDPSGERQFDSFGLPIVKIYPPMPPVKPPRT